MPAYIFFLISVIYEMLPYHVIAPLKLRFRYIMKLNIYIIKIIILEYINKNFSIIISYNIISYLLASGD